MENKEQVRSSKVKQSGSMDTVGGKVADIMNSATRKVNKMLKPLGFCVNIQVDFCELNKEEAVKES